MFFRLILFIGFTVVINASNFLTNSGAEEGISPWTTFGGGYELVQSTNYVHSGEKSFLSSNRTQFYHGPSYNLKTIFDNGIIENGKRYRVSVWVYHLESSEQKLSLNLKKSDSSGTKYITIEDEVIPPNEWVEIVGFYTFNISDPLSSLNLYVVTNSGTTFDFYSDDFFVGDIENYTPPTQSSENEFIKANGMSLNVNNQSIVLKGINVSVPNDSSDTSEDIWATKSISKKDFAFIKELGFNSIRLGMNYTIFEDDNNIGVFKEDGWNWLDMIVSYAKDNGLYLMLDMHAPQGGYQSDKAKGFSAFWDGSGESPNTSNQNRLIALWTAIANRYKNEPTILGYDLINEPRPNNSDEWYNFSQQIVDAIRTVDTNHMIILEVPFIPNYSFSTINDTNVLYDSHFYETWEYTTQYSQAYGRDGQRWGKYNDVDSPMGENFNKEYLTTRLQEDALDDAYANNVPLNVGEYGIVHEAFYEDVNAKKWMEDTSSIFDGDNPYKTSISRFYFNYQGNTFGLYRNWTGFYTTNSYLNSELSNYWETYFNQTTINQNQFSDILWKRDNNISQIWYMGENGKVGHKSLGDRSSWIIQGIGDFNGDGISDILWKRDDNRSLIWYMGENGKVAHKSLGDRSSWLLQGTGDFNGDGISDILWKRDDNRSLIWYMGENGKVAHKSLGDRSSWILQGIGDFNGDGISDILWKRDDNISLIWYMGENGKVAHKSLGDRSSWIFQAIGNFE